MSDEAVIIEGANITKPTVVCYSRSMITTNGIWQGDNPLEYSLPLFLLQLSLVVITTRVLVYIFKPIRQPRVISEILAGVILGPSVLGQNPKFAETIFPLRSVMILETMANIGLLYFIFIVGVETDIAVIKRTGKMTLTIAIAGMIVPFLMGFAYAFMLHQGSSDIVNLYTYALFLGITLSVTAFPVLARILADLKLLNTDIGRIAMSAALINDMCAWIMLAFTIALVKNEAMSLASIWVILTSAGFVVVCVYIVRPLISLMISCTPEGESISEFHLCLILTGVMISGFITDAIGTHSVFGAFIFGLIIPKGPLCVTLIERLEDFVSGLLLPLFFAISGLKTNIYAINGFAAWTILVLVMIFVCAGKIVGTILATLHYGIPFYEGLTLGLLMNAKGLIEMIVLNVGKDQKVLDEKSFSILVIIAIGMTSIISPVITHIYNPARRFMPYTRRTIQSTKFDSELRVLVCVHTPRNVPTMISLLQASQSTKNSPIMTYVLHLVELTGRASAMVIVHNARKSGHPAMNRTQAMSDHIVNAFMNFENQSEFVSVFPLTAISRYSTMHEDIRSLSEDKRAAIVIVPFHKQQTVDGEMVVTNPIFRTINENVLANAPCSVGILVDRGFGGSRRVGGGSSRITAGNMMSHHVAVLFFGGADDREGLSYGWRMCQCPGVSLTVVRFVAAEMGVAAGVDDECVNEFRAWTENDSSVVYVERVVKNGEETVAVIRSMDPTHDLFIVGRGQGMASPLTAGLTDWSECPELGGVGDLLASSDFGATYSVLVVQQHVGIEGFEDNIFDSPKISGQHHDELELGYRQPPLERGHSVFQVHP